MSNTTKLTETEAAALIQAILPPSADADDSAAKGLITLIDRLTAATDATAREHARETFYRAIFCNSAAFDNALTAFIGNAEA